MVRWFKRALSTEHRLGPLEAHLLSALRRRGDATVRELMAENELDVAYTTVMTTLDRLYKKGLVERASDGGRARAFRYRPKQTEQDFFRAIMGADLKRLLASGLNPSAPLSFLVDTVTEHDAALLNELARAVNRKRRELRGREEA
jgi:predicted transcriptional regulator